MFMKTRSAKGVLAASLLLLTSMAFAADPQVEALLGHMREAYKAVKAATYKTSTTEWETGQDVDEPVTIQLDFAYKSPNLIRIGLTGGPIPGVVTVLSDGDNVTASSAQGTRPVGPYSVKLMEGIAPMNLESISFWDWKRQLSTAKGDNMATSTFKIVKDEEWDGKHWTVLEETAAKDKVFCRYFIDPNTYLIWRTKVSNLDTKKTRMDAKITSMDTKANLNDAMFKGA